MRKLLNKKGFTLAELLIVVAIIAVLVAIAIPIFTTQLEKSREQTDAANLRAAYAVAAAAVLESQTDIYAGPVELKQTGDWDHVSGEKIGTFDLSTAPKTGPLYVKVTQDGVIDIISELPTGKTAINPVTGK